MLKLTRTQHGFTIVELLIVIVVIGILAAITVVAYNGIQEKSRVQKANSDLNALVKAIHVGRISADKTLMGITGNGCTACGTVTNYNSTIDKIATASNTNLQFLKAGDPWGNPYVIDENEGESSTTPCRQDGLSVTNSGTHAGLIVPKIEMYNC